MLELKDVAELMSSRSYSDRFVAEYYQLKIRYYKLKALNIKIEAGTWTDNDCPYEVLREQQSIMGEYLHILELRAEIEGIKLRGEDLEIEYEDE